MKEGGEKMLSSFNTIIDLMYFFIMPGWMDGSDGGGDRTRESSSCAFFPPVAVRYSLAFLRTYVYSSCAYFTYLLAIFAFILVLISFHRFLSSLVAKV